MTHEIPIKTNLKRGLEGGKNNAEPSLKFSNFPLSSTHCKNINVTKLDVIIFQSETEQMFLKAPMFGLVFYVVILVSFRRRGLIRLTAGVFLRQKVRN